MIALTVSDGDSSVKEVSDQLADLLDVAKLQEPSMAEKAIDRLVMRDGNKKLIKSIAKTYTDSSARFKADFIYGKGEGQIILLHGPPGTGKTLTAGMYLDLWNDLLFNLIHLQSPWQSLREDLSSISQQPILGTNLRAWRKASYSTSVELMTGMQSFC
jgi:hypothetical protein